MGKGLTGLVVGGGGREAMYGRVLSDSPHFGRVIMNPGNGGSHVYAEQSSRKIDYDNGAKDWIRFLKSECVDIVVSGSETDLVKGLGDIVRAEGIGFVGVSGAAAKFEGSKIFATRFRDQMDIPQSNFEVFDSEDYAKSIIKLMDYGKARFNEQDTKGLVLKLDGLAGGKGAIVCRSLDEFNEGIITLIAMSKLKPKIVVEDFVEGVEISLTAAIYKDGSYDLLSFAQDYKPEGVGDTGRNTGGMGAITFDLTNRLLNETFRKRIIEKTIESAHRIGRPLDGGILYVGIIVEPNLNVNVLEFNIRGGDPEIPVLLKRMKGDPAEMFLALAHGETYRSKNIKEQVALVVMAANGYPGAYSHSVGKQILGIDEASTVPNGFLNIAGTTFDPGSSPDLSTYYVAGSRNLHCGGIGANTVEALRVSYEVASKIESNGLFMRPDIGCNFKKLRALDEMGVKK